MIGVRLENGKYPTLRPFLKQTWQAALSEKQRFSTSTQSACEWPLLPQNRTWSPVYLKRNYRSIGLIVPDECWPMTCVYIWVVFKSVCPNSSWTVRMSVPAFKSCVAKECLNVCAVTCFWTHDRITALLNFFVRDVQCKWWRQTYPSTGCFVDYRVCYWDFSVTPDDKEAKPR